MMLRAAFLFVLLAAPAAAAELRPVADTKLCLTARIGENKPDGPVTAETCANRPDQQFRAGKLSTIYADGGRCLQAVRTTDKDEGTVVTARCHGMGGQRWALARGGQFVNDSRTCLTFAGAGAPVTVAKCKEGEEDQTDQKWALYGDFNR